MLLRPASKVVIKFLQLMQKHGYIGEFEKVDDHRAGKIVVELNGRLNKCGVMSPRYDVSGGGRAWGGAAVWGKGAGAACDDALACMRAHRRRRTLPLSPPPHHPTRSSPCMLGPAGEQRRD